MSEPGVDDRQIAAPPAPVTVYAPPAAAPDGASPPVEPPRCPNCGAAADGPYCAQCGQSQRDRLRAALPQLLGEGIEELLDVDARVAVTLRRLLFRPGFLTLEYLAGRRARYVRPLRLYLTASILFFVVLSLKASGDMVRTDDEGVRTYGGVLRISPGSARADSLARADSAGAPDSTGAAGGDGFLASRLTRFSQLSEQERGRIMRDAVLGHLPKAFFALVPAFALALKLLYLRRRLHYAEHLIFALHVHAFAFLVNGAREAVPERVEVVAGPLILGWILVYLFLALRRVHGESRRRTVAKMALLLPAYAVALVAALAAVVFAAMVFA